MTVKDFRDLAEAKECHFPPSYLSALKTPAVRAPPDPLHSYFIIHIS